MATVNDLNPLSDISIGGVGQALLIFFFAICRRRFYWCYCMDVCPKKAIKIYNSFIQKKLVFQQ